MYVPSICNMEPLSKMTGSGVLPKIILLSPEAGRIAPVRELNCYTSKLRAGIESPFAIHN